jgi:hypothetical protein
MSVPAIQLRIIRDNTNSLKDEIFTITKGMHNDWRLNHRSAFSQSNSTMFVKKIDHVISYIYAAFDLLKIDNEMYQFVQLDAPCYPVALVSRADILCGSDTLHKLVRVVEQVLDNWPTSCHPWSP